MFCCLPFGHDIFFSQSTSAYSTLLALKIMYYTNPRFTYLLIYCLRLFDVTVKRPLNFSTLYVNLFGILAFVPSYRMLSLSNKSIISAKYTITSSNAMFIELDVCELNVKYTRKLICLLIC